MTHFLYIFIKNISVRNLSIFLISRERKIIFSTPIYAYILQYHSYLLKSLPLPKLRNFIHRHPFLQILFGVMFFWRLFFGTANWTTNFFNVIYIFNNLFEISLPFAVIIGCFLLSSNNLSYDHQWYVWGKNSHFTNIYNVYSNCLLEFEIKRTVNSAKFNDLCASDA